MTEGLALACLAQYAPEPSLAAHANQNMQWYIICYQWFKQGLMTERLSTKY